MSIVVVIFTVLCLAVCRASLEPEAFDELSLGNLPAHTLWPGPWEFKIKASKNKSHIQPVQIWKTSGISYHAESMLEDFTAIGKKTIIEPGSWVAYEFQENIGGRVCFNVHELKNEIVVGLAYSESSAYAGPEPDATTDKQERDLPLLYVVRSTGLQCVGPQYVRGGFKYLTLHVLKEIPDDGFWHDDVHPSNTRHTRHEVDSREQKVLKAPELTENLSISELFVNCTNYPSNPNPRAYTGYFHSSSELLNRIWYAGAYTLQLSTIDPREGDALVDIHNPSPPGTWYSNFTISNGTTVTTDGAKRDRMVWPGDMGVAGPGIAVSTFDMISIRNALETLFAHQYGFGGLPYAGPPGGSAEEFSDTYHLHTLLGVHVYITYSGDKQWLEDRWDAYVRALDLSIAKVDETGLLHVTSTMDWLRPGLSGHNLEASALLYTALFKSIELGVYLFGLEEFSQQKKKWNDVASRLREGIDALYCEEEGLYADNLGRRGCGGPEKVLPQDGNSWVLIGSMTSSERALNISHNLRARWNKFGAPATEFPGVMSPFASSFELLGHAKAGNPDAVIDLTELMWGYMLDGNPEFTNSTFVEGYGTDGDMGYPAYGSRARNSHAHGWSTGPTSVLMTDILGIQIISPGGSQWKIQPRGSGKVKRLQGGYATGLGRFEVRLERCVHSNGRKLELLEFVTPRKSKGVLEWAGSKKELRGGRYTFARDIEDDVLVWYAALEDRNMQDDNFEENWEMHMKVSGLQCF